jgi:hypothetical protein
MKAKPKVDDFGKQPIPQATIAGIIKVPRFTRIPGNDDHNRNLVLFFDQGEDFLRPRVAAVRTEGDDDTPFHVRIILDQAKADSRFFLQVHLVSHVAGLLRRAVARTAIDHNELADQLSVDTRHNLPHTFDLILG